MKKNNKGFTLIELLAIIVILAIIAVITVPIILNIIENSKKGATTDSAYGYKDAVNKAYIQELSKPNNGSLKLNGIYVVQSDGTLEPASGYTFGVTGYNSLPVSLSGTKPSSGKLHYTNNILDDGCLVIGDYKITFKSDGSINETVKGNCDDYVVRGGSEQGESSDEPEESVPTAFIYESKEEANSNNPTIKSLATARVGDYVKIGNEGFYIVEKQQNKTLLLTEYSLGNLSTTVDNEWRQTDSTEIPPIYAGAFSPTAYWTTEENIENSDYKVYDENDQPIAAYIYNSDNPRLYPIIENYKAFLLENSDKILDARLMSVEEAINAGYSADTADYNTEEEKFNQSCEHYACDGFWLGNINTDGTMFIINSNVISDGANFYDEDGWGIRPIIEISNNAF